jgi:hypothetical protein
MATSTAVHAVDRNDGLDLSCHLLLFPRSVTSAFCRRFNLSPILKSEASETVRYHTELGTWPGSKEEDAKKKGRPNDDDA